MGGSPIKRHDALVGLALAALALSLSLSGVAAGEGHLVGEPHCPKKTLCLWKHANFEGQRVKIDETGISNKIAEEMNNEASSIRNRRGKVSFLYQRRNGKGEKVCIAPGTQGDLVNQFNDWVSSTRLSKKATVCP